MKEYCLLMKWDYEYDKEGTWFDIEKGETIYSLVEGMSYDLPHMYKKKITIKSVEINNDVVKVEVEVDYSVLTIINNGEIVNKSISSSYMVCGDSVHQTLMASFQIILN